jgi:type IV pilus assembly protein PilV
MTMTRSPKSMPGPAGQGGMMLLEALIAILIFSIGVLGIIGVQALAMQQSGDARYRAAAARLADELLGKMWVDNKSIANLQAQYCNSSCANTTYPGYTDWATTKVTDAHNGLPGVNLTGATKPLVNVDANGVVTITLYWRSPSDDPAADPHQYNMQAQIGQ